MLSDARVKNIYRMRCALTGRGYQGETLDESMAFLKEQTGLTDEQIQLWLKARRPRPDPDDPRNGRSFLF